MTLRFGSPTAMQTKATRYATDAEAITAVAELIADKLDDRFIEGGQHSLPSARRASGDALSSSKGRRANFGRCGSKGRTR